MRRPQRTLKFLNNSFIATSLALTLGGGCSGAMDGVDADSDSRDLSMLVPRDLAMNPADLAMVPRDLAMAGGDMAMSTPDMAMSTPDMAMSTRDLAMSAPDLAMSAPDLAMSTPDLAMSTPDLAMGPRDLAMSTPDLAMGPRDLAMGPTDLAMGPADLAMGPRDMATGPADLATSDGGRTYTCRGLDAPGTTYQVATDSLILPTGSGAMAYTYDFDGSGRKKNGLKGLVQTVALAGLDLQTPIDIAVANGATIQLASLTTADLMNASCAGLSAIPAQPAMTPPRFDGTDVFSHFPIAPADLIGSITAGKLQTKASKDLLATEDAVLELQLSIGAMSLALPIHGVHVEGTVQRVGTITRIRNGMLHGVISATDLDLRLIPGIAATVTNLINSDPMSAATKLIISLLETTTNPVSVMKCMVPSMCCKTSPATCTILSAEIKMSLLGAVLAPDIQAFDTMGKWHPVPAGTSLNGFTVGIGFNAVSATYH